MTSLIIQNNINNNALTDQTQLYAKKNEQNPNHNQQSISNNLLEELQENLTNLIHSQLPILKQTQQQPKLAQQHHQQQQEYFTKDLLDISRTNINFSKSLLCPGAVDEVELFFGLRDDIQFDDDPRAAYLVKVITSCHNTEFNDLDQYVISVRSNQRYQYFQQIRFRIKKKDRAGIRVAIKVPPIRRSQIIEGRLTIQLQNTVPVFLEIFAKCQVPQIVCLKDLYDERQKTHMIKIPGKKSVRMPPIPFKNLSNFNFILQAQVVSNVDFSKRAYDIIVQNSISVQQNSPFFVNIQLKTNQSYRGIMPLTDTLRKILILRIRNCSLSYSFPIEVFVFQSLNNSSMS